MTTEDVQLQVEGLMDATNLRCVLMAVAETCYAKADLLETNWQDTVSAREWAIAAQRIAMVAASLAAHFAA